MPQGELEALNTQDPLDVLAHQYDIVCNGYELCSGAVRNHRPDIMLRAFEIAGYSSSAVEEEFAGFPTHARHGAPPHGGLDRPALTESSCCWLGNKGPSARVIAFPLNPSKARTCS